MRKFQYKKYIVLICFLFLILSIPPALVYRLRNTTFICLSPILKKSKKQNCNNTSLEAENHLLKLEIGKLRNLAGYVPKDLKIVQSNIIYRDPGSWSSSVWIDVGKKTSCVVKKNSPVLFGRALVGVIDYVGKNQSRVRLITDVSVKPSVRVVRGNIQNRFLLDHINPILRHISLLSDEKYSILLKELSAFKESVSQDEGDGYLAKGFLQGAGAPLWRSMSQTLRGVGFNYDFADARGAAMNLSDVAIHEHDLLMTSGMDGVFPEGLLVAEVTKVYPLKEGDYTYEIEAVPIAENLNSLQTLFVISPVGYDENEQPTHLFFEKSNQ